MSLFPPLPSSASSKSSGVSEWSKVSTGESKGVSTKATLFVGQESITYCLSCVGSTGLVVCCKPRGEQAESCGTKHNGERFEFPAGRTLQDLVFIHDPKNKTRFLSEPWADRKWFSEAALKVMSSDYKSVPEWSEVFRVAQIRAYEDLQPASVESIQSSLEFVANAQELKTPGRKAPKKDDPIIKDIPKSPFLTEQDITMRNEWYNNELLPKGLVAHVEKLGDAMNEVMERMDSQEGEDKNLFLDVVDDLMKIKVWQERTEASIGNSLPLFGREFPNLWSALDYSVRQEEESTIKQIVDLQELVFELKDREDASNKELQSFLGDVSQSFENVKAHLGDMTAELNALKMAQSRQASSGATTPGSRARIQNGVLFPPLTPSNPSKPLGKDEADDTLKIVVELRKRITKLEGSRISGSGSGGDGPPHFGGLGLTCIEDLASWNMERGLGHYFGLFQDANSLLTFKRSEFVDSHEHMATLKRARDVGLNLIQAKLLVSFQNQVPLFFGKGSPNKTSALNALPTARDWEEDDGTSGAKHDLDRALPSINKQLQSYIDVYLGEDQHEARALANRCLSQSLLFIHKLSDFITRSYRTMMLLKYDAVKSWTFLMRQVKRIWEDIGRARACCVDLGSPTDLEEVGGGVFQNHNAALAMWGVLKAHDVMNDYLRHNFEDHPSIAAEQVRWVTRNVMGGDKQSSDSDVKTLEGRISKGEKAVAALKTSLDKITTRVDTVEKKV